MLTNLRTGGLVKLMERREYSRGEFLTALKMSPLMLINYILHSNYVESM